MVSGFYHKGGVQKGLSALLLLFFIATGSAHAQLDSLLRQLPKQKDDTNKVHLLGSIIKEYVLSDVEKMVPYIKEMISLSQKINYPKGEAKGYLRYADYYRRIRKWDLALPYIQRADSIFTQTNDPGGKANVDNFTGVYYTEKGMFDKALSRHLKALEYFRSVNDKALEASTLSVIGKVFYYMQRYDESEQYYLKALDIQQQLGNQKEVSVALLNIGSMHTLQKNYTKAEYYLNQCYQLQKNLQQPAVMAKINWNMGWILAEKNDIPQSLQLLQQALTTYTEVHDTLMMGLSQMYQAHTYNKAGKYDEALQLLNNGKKLAYIGGADSILIGDFYQEYYQVYKNKGDFKKALEYHEKYIENKSGIFSTETANKISELKEKYETEKKEQENLTLKKSREIQDLRLHQQWYFIYGLAIIFVLAVFIFLLLIRNNRIIARQKNIMLEQKLLRSQMNPHFIFNALIAIQSFIYKNNPREAGKFLSSFAKLMRSILDNSRDEYITLSREISWTNNYLELQKLRFENNFNYHIHIDEKLDPENILIPPMLTQPFIENAVEHGLQQGAAGGYMEVGFTLVNNYLHIYISDNGKGFSNASNDARKPGHVSMAIHITRERLAFLNRKKSKKIHFQIQSENNQGTRVEFTIPLMYSHS